MKIKPGKRKVHQKRQKKSSKIALENNEINNYHAKKKQNSIEKENEEFDEKIYKEKLREIYELIKNKKYEKKPNDVYLNTVSNVLINDKYKNILEKISNVTQCSLISSIELIYKFNYEKTNKTSNELDKCSICQYNFYEEDEDINNKKEEKEKNEAQEKLSDFDELCNKEINVVLLKNCHDHFFHLECLDLLIGNKNSFKCPNCSKIYGILIGDQPKGTMYAHISSNIHCSGYEDYDTIVIDYDFPSGKGYSGTYRTAFLPNNKEGKEVLGLLKVCFDRKLTFTVGTSVTTGVSNTTVWNGVHHKTNLYGGSTHFGYPDKTYFNRVKEELASKGVIQDNIDEDVTKIADDLLNNQYD